MCSPYHSKHLLFVIPTLHYEECSRFAPSEPVMVTSFWNQMHFLHAVVYSSGWGSSRLPCDDPPTTALGPAANLAMPHAYPPELCLWRYCWCNLPDHASPVQNGNDYSIATSQLVHYVQEPRVDHVTDDSWPSAYRSFDSHEIDL